MAKAAHMTEVDHELAAVLFTRQDKMDECGSQQTNMAHQRKLARMAAVRQKDNEGPQIISVSWTRRLFIYTWNCVVRAPNNKVQRYETTCLTSK